MNIGVLDCPLHAAVEATEIHLLLPLQAQLRLIVPQRRNLPTTQPECNLIIEVNVAISETTLQSIPSTVKIPIHFYVAFRQHQILLRDS